MTNVDYEGFNDWSDEELKEATSIIYKILDGRHQKKVLKALEDLKASFENLQKVAEIDEDDNITTLYHGDYSLTDIFTAIENYCTKVL